MAKPTAREQAANIMQTRLSWPTAVALADDLERAGLLTQPTQNARPDPMRELAESLAAKEWMLPYLRDRGDEAAAVLASAIKQSVALGKKDG